MYYYGTVVGVEMYANDVRVIREGHAPTAEAHERGTIEEFTLQSRQRLAFTASNTSVCFTTMITLTYPGEFPSDGEKVRRDRATFLKWLHRDQPRGFEYLWFLEFQKRGAPHLHMLTDQLYPRTRDAEKALRFRIAASWYRIVGSGDRRHLQAGTRCERLRSARGGAFYAVKYAQKMKQKKVPVGYRNVGRFWGHSRKVKPEPDICLRATEDDIRGVMEGSEYAPKDVHHLWKTLYNAREIFDAFIETGSEVDKRTG